MANLLYKQAAASPHYQCIRDECVRRLTKPNEDGGTCSFEKHAVLVETGYEAFESVIRWDYIKRMIEETYDTELIALVATYFSTFLIDRKERKEHPPATFPERYMAKGNGKRTAGYASAVQENSHFVLKALAYKHGSTLGHAKAHKKLCDSAQRTGVLGVPDRTETVEVPVFNKPKMLLAS